jgi:hypothetical protein
MKNQIQDIDNHIKRQNINNVVYNKDKKAVKTKYNFDWKKVLDNPPLNDSFDTLADLNYLSRITDSRTKNESNLVLLVDEDPKILFINLLENYGLKFPEEKFDQYYDILEPYIVESKNYFNRARPKQIGDLLGKKINVLETKTHHTPSYPSGHTCYAKLCELLCSQEYPKLKQHFLDIVNTVAYCRELQGVHYRSDNKASIIFTTFIYQELQKIIG